MQEYLVCSWVQFLKVAYMTDRVVVLGGSGGHNPPSFSEWNTCLANLGTGDHLTNWNWAYRKLLWVCGGKDKKVVIDIQIKENFD